MFKLCLIIKNIQYSKLAYYSNKKQKSSLNGEVLYILIAK